MKIKLSKVIILLTLVITVAFYLLIAYLLKKDNHQVDNTIIGNVIKARQLNISFEYDKADIFYNKALELDPYNDNLLEEYLLFSVARKNFNTAFDISQKVIIKSPNHFLANLILVTNNLKENNIEQAISHLQALTPESGSLNDILLNLLLSLEAYKNGDVAQFKKLNENIKEILPDFYQYLYGITALYFKDQETAKRELLDLNNNYPNIEAVTYYAKILYEEDKEEGIAYFKEYLDDNFLSESVIAKYLENTPEITISKILSDIMLHVSRLMSSEVNQNFLTSDSFIVTNVALMINNNNHAATLSASAFYESIGAYATSIEYYNKIPNNTYYNRLSTSRSVEILIDTNQKNKALKLLQTKAIQEPTNPTPFLEQGNIYHNNKEYKKAITSYKHALAISEKNNNTLTKWLAYYFMGISYDKLGDWDKAEKALLEASSIDDNDPLLINYLAYSWIDRDYNISQSLTMLEKALSIENNNPSILDSYSWGLFKSEQYEKALEYANKANNINPYDPVLASHLGDILWQLGDTKSALSYWNSAINLGSDETLRTQLNNKIEGKLPNYLNKDNLSKLNSDEDFVNKVKAGNF